MVRSRYILLAVCGARRLLPRLVQSAQGISKGNLRHIRRFQKSQPAAISFERSGNGSGRGQKQKEISCTSPAPPSSVCVMRVLAPAATLVVGGHALAALPASTRLHGLFGGLAVCHPSLNHESTNPFRRTKPTGVGPTTAAHRASIVPHQPIGVPAGRGVIRPRRPTMAWSLPNVEPRFAGTRTPNHNDVIVRHSKSGERPLVTLDVD